MFNILKVKSSYQINKKSYSTLKRYLIDIEGVIDVFIDEINSHSITIKHSGNESYIEQEAAKILEINANTLTSQSSYPITCSCSNAQETHVTIADEDILSTLLSRGEVCYSRDGEFYYGAMLKKAIEKIDTTFLRLMSNFFNYEESYSSPAIKMESLGKITDLSELSRELMIASHFDNTSIDKVNDTKTKPKWVLPAAPCLKIYLLNENKEINSNLIYSTRGLCFRNESKEKHGFERMETFNQRELVFIGDKEHVSNMVALAKEKIFDFFKHLSINVYDEVAKDPFFMNPDKREKYDINGSIKTEIRARLNNSGKSISVASFDVHGNFFGKKCNIKKENEEVFSACLGIGIERIIWAFLIQNGFDALKGI